MMTLALKGQSGTNLPGGRPILTRIAIFNDIKDILEVHLWDAREPMHQSLNVSFAAHTISMQGQEAGKKLLHLPRATHRSYCRETNVIQWNSFPIYCYFFIKPM